MKQEIKAIRKLYEKQFLQLNKSDWTEAALKRAEAAEKVCAGRLKVLEEKAAKLKEAEQLLERAEARAEAAEKQLADMKAAYEYCLTGEKEAEERVKELEKLLEGRIYEHNLCLKALAGEKTK